MNNYEKIKSMSVDEMAEWMNVIELSCHHACLDLPCGGNNELCLERIKQWLLAETTEGK